MERSVADLVRPARVETAFTAESAPHPILLLFSLINRFRLIAVRSQQTLNAESMKPTMICRARSYFLPVSLFTSASAFVHRSLRAQALQTCCGQWNWMRKMLLVCRLPVYPMTCVQ